MSGAGALSSARRRLVRRTRHRPRAGRLMVFSGRSNEELAAAIAARVGVPLGDVGLDTFANGEAAVITTAGGRPPHRPGRPLQDIGPPRWTARSASFGQCVRVQAGIYTRAASYEQPVFVPQSRHV